MPDPGRPRLLAGLILAAALTCTACGTVPTAAPTPAASTSTSSSPATPTPSPTASASAPVSSVGPRPGLSSPPSSATPSQSTAPAKTSTYADDLALAGDRLTYSQLRWYWGKAARARCKAKKIKAEFEWCNDYYYENTRKKGSGTMATNAKIKILDDDGQPVTASTAELARALDQDTWPHWRV